MMTEMEYKLNINQQQFLMLYEKAKGLFPEIVPKRKLQINYYYDTPDLYLYQNEITLRIRQIDDILKLQLKTNKCCDEVKRTSDEYCVNVQKLPNNINTKELPINLSLDCNLLGSLVTERYSYIIKNGVKVEFDINYYLGFIDYEIEIEYTEENVQIVAEIFKTLSCDVNIAKMEGKYSRFISKLKEINIKKVGF
jgi:uncharacterized protein YjbK